jgi:hypothetical protein
MKKVVFISLVIGLSVFLAGPSFATGVLGQYCFKMDTYSDTWVWQVEQVRPGYLQVTGYDVPNGNCAMNGGGYVAGEILRLTVQESCPDNAIYGMHSISLNLSTLSGTTDLVWHDSTGSAYVSFEDLTFQKVACDLAGEAVESDLPSTSGN